MHADTKPFGEALRKDLDKYLKDAEKRAGASGTRSGKAYAKGYSGELRKGFQDVRKDFTGVEKAVSRSARRAATGARKEFKKGLTDINNDTNRAFKAVGNTFLAFFFSSAKNVQDWASGISGALSGVFSSAGGGLQQLAVYAALAVAVVGLVIGALGVLIPLVLSLGAALASLVGVVIGAVIAFAPLFLIFKGLAPVMSVLAGSTKDFNDALKKVSPQLRPLAEALRVIALAVKKLPLAQFLNPLLPFIRELGRFLGSKNFLSIWRTLESISSSFLLHIFQAFGNQKWHSSFEKFIGSVAKIMNSLSFAFADLADAFAAVFNDPAVQAAFVQFGQIFATLVFDFAQFLLQIQADGTLSNFLDSALQIFEGLLQVFVALSPLVAAFMTPAVINAALQFLQVLTTSIGVIAAFLASKQGQTFITDMIRVLEILVVAVAGLIILMIKVDAIMHNTVKNIKAVWSGLGLFFSNLWNNIKESFVNKLNTIITAFNKLISAINKIPGIHIPSVSLIGGGKGTGGSLGAAGAAAASSSGKGTASSVGGRTPKASANGNVFTRADVTSIAEGNKPEVVIPLTKPDRARALADQTGLTRMLTGERSMSDIYVFVGNKPVEAIVEYVLDGVAHTVTTGRNS